MTKSIPLGYVNNYDKIRYPEQISKAAVYIQNVGSFEKSRNNNLNIL